MTACGAHKLPSEIAARTIDATRKHAHFLIAPTALTLRQRKTTTKGSKHYERDQLSQARISSPAASSRTYFESAPTAGDSNRRSRLAITQFAGRVMAD
jgi:hypothetical protein